MYKDPHSIGARVIEAGYKHRKPNLQRKACYQVDNTQFFVNYSMQMLNQIYIEMFGVRGKGRRAPWPLCCMRLIWQHFGMSQMGYLDS